MLSDCHRAASIDCLEKALFITLISSQGRSQEFAKGGEPGGLGTDVPLRGPGAEPRWGSGGEAPSSRRQMWIRKTNKPPI